MKLSRLLAAALLGALALAFSGCMNNPDTQRTGKSTVPWNRPADWEGQIPGMGR